jgi:hypothetical protein
MSKNKLKFKLELGLVEVFFSSAIIFGLLMIELGFLTGKKFFIHLLILVLLWRLFSWARVKYSLK